MASSKAEIPKTWHAQATSRWVPSFLLLSVLGAGLIAVLLYIKHDTSSVFLTVVSSNGGLMPDVTALTSSKHMLVLKVALDQFVGVACTFALARCLCTMFSKVSAAATRTQKT